MGVLLLRRRPSEGHRCHASSRQIAHTTCLRLYLLALAADISPAPCADCFGLAAKTAAGGDGLHISRKYCAPARHATLRSHFADGDKKAMPSPPRRWLRQYFDDSHDDIAAATRPAAAIIAYAFLRKTSARRWRIFAPTQCHYRSTPMPAHIIYAFHAMPLRRLGMPFHDDY